MANWTKKRIIVCMDGTWQTLRRDSLTNIAVIARSIAHEAVDPETGQPIQQIVIYSKGLGAKIDLLAKEKPDRKIKSGGGLLAGIFGNGLEQDLLDTYLRIAFNYQAGDEIYIFGYSRGAFSARSLAGLIGKCGIVSRRYVEMADEAFRIYRDKSVGPDDDKAKNFRIAYGKRVRTIHGERLAGDHRPAVTYLGVFDTVGQRGVPTLLGPLSHLFNGRFGFHDLHLGGHVRSARHALAVDEASPLFPHTPWENLDRLNEVRRPVASADPDFEPYQQRWFAGNHGEVGGGGPLSLFPLLWIMDGAEAAGLVFDRTTDSPIDRLLRRYELDVAAPAQRVSLLGGLVRQHRQIAAPKRAPGLFPRAEPFTREEALRLLHRSVALRAIAEGLKPPYKPKPLKHFRKAAQALGRELETLQALAAQLRDAYRKD